MVLVMKLSIMIIHGELLLLGLIDISHAVHVTSVSINFHILIIFTKLFLEANY